MTEHVLDYEAPRPAGRRPRRVLPAAGLYWIAGAILPLACLVLNLGLPLTPAWQSGLFHDKVLLLLSPRVGWPFYPLLAYAILCMALVLRDPIDHANRTWVRLGVYSGVFLALHHALIIAVPLLGPTTPRAAVVPLALGGIIAAAIGVGVLVWMTRQVVGQFGMAGWVALVVLVVLFGVVTRGIGLLLLVVSPVAASPVLALVAYGSLSTFVWRRADVDPRSGEAAMPFLSVGWVVAYVSAWHLAVDEAVREYARLPTAAPDCYVAAAAAKGHPIVVRSEILRTTRGTIHVNAQMRRLKCAEVALRAASPAAHRLCRAAYDRAGPVLASALVHPLLADAAYLLLKPAEMTAAGGLSLLVPDFNQLAARCYAPPAGHNAQDVP